MINRTFDAEVQSVACLKTDRGKQNRYIKYFESLTPYADLLLPMAQNRIDELN